MESNQMQVVETTWTVDGEELFAVALHDVHTASHTDAVAALELALECSRWEAEHAYRVIVEDGEFVVSVSRDIDTLD